MRFTEEPIDDARVAEYYALGPINFSQIERLELRQGAADDAYETRLDIEVRPVDPARHQRLLLSFEGVLNLRLTPPERMVIQFVLLEIHCVRRNQWEGVAYRVGETEFGTISFLCRDFTAKVA